MKYLPAKVCVLETKVVLENLILPKSQSLYLPS